MKIGKIVLPLGTALVIAVTMTGCWYDNLQDLHPQSTCDVSNVTYAGSVLPVISANCYSCHNAASQLGNVNLEGYSNLKAYANNGKLVGVIEHQTGFSPMPKTGGKLSDCEIAIIKQWISNGATNN